MEVRGTRAVPIGDGVGASCTTSGDQVARPVGVQVGVAVAPAFDAVSALVATLMAAVGNRTAVVVRTKSKLRA